jgi:hypothetical protein
MGCDIHLYTEKKIKRKDKEFWWCVDNFKPNEWNLDYSDEPQFSHKSIYDIRNYDLFAALADVRNYGNIIPIDEPRGLPDDISDIVKKEAEIWHGDGHSYSWLTAKEIFIYNNKYSETIQSGLITLEAAKELDEKGILPSMWCQWTNQEGYVKRSWKRPHSPVESLIEPLKDIMKEEFHVYDFYDEEKQEKMIWDNAEDFRLVYFFDN